ncbi:MAG TPA: hypothetical protein VFR43_10045 [Gaiellaceae bacterium]|nr:hypothetical protein [Gaiellaceae bacterium]
MVATSPRLHPRLVSLVFALDDPREPMAETWRAVSRRAEELGLPRPGYDTVRRLARVHRRRRAEIERLLAPVRGDLLSGHLSAWDLDRVLQAAEVAREERAARRREGGAL